MADESILRKIRGLELLRRGAKTEGEAAAAGIAVEKLLRKHNIQLGAVMIEQQDSGHEVALTLKTVTLVHRFCVQAATGLMDAGFYWLTLKIGSGNRKVCFIYGAKANIAAAQVTMNYFIKSVRSVTNKAPITAADRKEFAIGVAGCVHVRVKSHIESRNAAPEYQPGTVSETALVLAATKGKIEEYELQHKALFDYIRKSDQRSAEPKMIDISAGIRAAGYQAGLSIDLHGAQKGLNKKTMEIA